LAEFNAFERAMPGTRMRDAAEYVALFKLGKVQPRAEMLAIAGQHDGANFSGQGVKECHHALHQRVVQRIFSARCSRKIATGPRSSARREDGSLMALKSELTVDCRTVSVAALQLATV